MNNFKSFTPIILSAFALLGCHGQKEEWQLKVTNQTDLPLVEYPIKIARSELTVPRGDEVFFPLLISDVQDTLAAQLDDVDGDGNWDELFFLVDLDQHQEKMVNLRWITDSLAFEKRTQVRFGVRPSIDDIVKPAVSGTFLPHQLPLVTGYQPYQTDGPSWENDMVGFRHYLDGRNSKDVFGKKLANMSPDDVGINEEGVTEDNYHVMETWGRDILSVGNSLGIGGVSFLLDDRELLRMGTIEGDTLGRIDTTIFRILSEGPVRSIVDFQYRNWRPLNDSRTYNVEERVEIWPGFHGYKNTLCARNLMGDETWIVGLVNSRTNKPLKKVYDNDEWIVLATHDKQTYEKEWWLGLALVLPKVAYKGFIEAPSTGRIATTYLAKLEADEEVPVSYFALACWELRYERFREEPYFEEYLKNFVNQLSSDVTLEIGQE